MKILKFGYLPRYLLQQGCSQTKQQLELQIIFWLFPISAQFLSSNFGPRHGWPILIGQYKKDLPFISSCIFDNSYLFVSAFLWRTDAMAWWLERLLRSPVDLEFNPLVEAYQKTLKNDIHIFPAWVRHLREVVEIKPASSLVVSLGKALNGTSPSLCGRQVAQTHRKWQLSSKCGRSVQNIAMQFAFS